MPLAAQAAPSISWALLADGAVLSGNVSGAACADPTGNKYQATDLRSFVQQNQ